MTLWGAAALGTLAELKEFYQPGDATRFNVNRQTLLSESLGNHNSINRFEIASFLLDEGADPTWSNLRSGVNLLHRLLPSVREGLVDTDYVLLHRLLDGGADPNSSAKGFGTPLQLVDSYAEADESNVIPVCDVLFARDDLDLFSKGKFGHSTYSTGWKGREYNPVFWQRLQQYVADHGLVVPESEREPS